MNDRKLTSSNYANETYLTKRCPLNKSVDIIKKRWVIQILLGIDKGYKRFSELKANIEPISDFMLGKNLRHLENSGILDKTVCNDIENGTYYEFTVQGEELMAILKNMLAWGKKYKL